MQGTKDIKKAEDLYTFPWEETEETNFENKKPLTQAEMQAAWDKIDKKNK